MATNPFDDSDGVHQENKVTNSTGIKRSSDPDGAGDIEIRPGRFDDVEGLLGLHRVVVKDPDGFIRQPDEITVEYIEDMLHKSINHGLIFVATKQSDDDGRDRTIIGEIHAYTPSINAFRHLLMDLLIAVHPTVQGRRVGRRLFDTFLQHVPTNIARVELYTRETNARNVRFYERLGFINEGRQHHKICTLDGRFETPIHMAWFNPNFDVVFPYRLKMPIVIQDDLILMTE